MADALSKLKAAILRLQVEMRRRRKKKQRPQRPSGPRPSGPNANKGCGTGAGGFGTGNSCAKEDGIPNAPKRPPALGPVNAKADAAKAKSMKAKAAQKQAAKIAADKAKSEAYKKSPEYAKKQKQKRIDALRRKAAERKAEKGERDAAEKQAASEAAAKKRAEMLKKIRIKKANERLTVIDKPDPAFTGQLDPSVKKRASETQVDYVERRMQADLDRLDKEIESVSARRSKEIDRIEKEIQDLQAARDAKYESESASNKSKYALQAIIHGKVIDNRSPELKAMDERLPALRKELKAYKKESAAEIHAIIGKFTAAHGGGPSQIPTDQKSYKISGPKAQTKDTEWLKDAWKFLGTVVPKDMAHTVVGVNIKLRSRGGGSHSSYNNEVTIGGQSRSTAVHEYGHAIESKSLDTMRALDEDYRRRLAEFRAQHPNSGFVRHPQVSYYDGPELPTEAGKRPTRAGYKTYVSLLGYSKRYSDFGYNDSTRNKYAGTSNAPRYGRGTEVFSTGIESLYDDPLDYWRKYRKHFRITTMILSGRL